MWLKYVKVTYERAYSNTNCGAERAPILGKGAPNSQTGRKQHNRPEDARLCPKLWDATPHKDPCHRQNGRFLGRISKKKPLRGGTRPNLGAERPKHSIFP